MLPFSWTQMGFGAVAAFALSFLLHTLDVHRIDAAWQIKLAAQKANIETKCADDKRLTEENSLEYENQINDLASKLAAAKRLRPSRCIVPATGQAAVGNRAAAPNKYAGLDGINSDTLIDFAGECEHYRIQIKSLQGFIDNVWSMQGIAK